MKTSTKRLLSLMMAFAMVVTTVLTSDVTTAYAASSSKSVKSVTLKIGTKNVTKKTTKMYVKDTAALKVTVNPSKAKKSVTYKSNKTSVATVSSKGKITAKKAGTAKITVTVKGKDNKKKSTYVNVKVQNRPVKSIKLSAKKVSLKKGESKTIKATVSPSNATVKTVKWTSNNTGVATVSSKGKITAKEAGTAVITAKAGSKSAKCTVVVTDDSAVTVPVTGVTISQTELVLAINTTTPLKATVTPDNATNKNVTWSSSNTAVATVDAMGNVTSVAEGNAKIKVTTVDGEYSAECAVTVKDGIAVTGLTLSAPEIEVAVNAKSTLIATVTPENAVDKTVKWSSDNPLIANVDSNGVVTGIAEGQTKIKATTSDGKFSAECTVVVIGTTDTNASDVSIRIANSLKDYADTVLTGTNADVKCLVTNKAGNPLGNTSVTLEIQPQFGNASYVFGITGDNNNYVSGKITTDENGYASFTIGQRGGYTYTSTDLIYQSYKLTATVTGSNVKSESTLSFACIDVGDVQVLNNRDMTLNNIEPGENAGVWNGIAGTYSNDGAQNEEYVSSQKVSTFDKDGGRLDDHRVYITAAPYIVLPAKNNQTVIDKYYEDNFKKESTPYNVYNTEENENTTTRIKEVPAGLEHATLVFSKITLSKYTTLQIKTYDSLSGACIKTYIMNESNMKPNEFGYQIPIQEDTPVDVEVSLISAGQVNDDSNDGFVIDHIEGLYKTEVFTQGERKELENTVEWSDSKTYYSEYIQMTYEKASQYIKDEKYLSEKYTYAYETPNFPNTGDAVIKVTDANDKVVAYFLYPTENQWKNYDGTLYPTNTTVKNTTNLNNDTGYQNKNEISLPNKYSAAVKASEEEVSNTVGEWKQIGNIVEVDSMKSGRTNLKATIKIPGVTEEQLNPTNGSELYTSVQWAPIPELERDGKGDDFYAIATQYISVKAQLYDTNGNKVTTKDKKVTFKLNGEEIKEEELEALGDNRNVTIQRKDKVSNEHGQATIQFRSNDDKGYVYHLSAECEGYIVKLLVGPKETETELANLYWVKLGLSFTDKVAFTRETGDTVTEIISTTSSTLKGDSVVQSINSEGKLVNNIDSRRVGNNWIFGYQLVGNIDYGNTVSDNKVKDISNVKVILTKSEDSPMTMTTEGQPNGAAKCYTEKTGSETIMGAIGNNSFTEGVENAGDVVFTIVDEFGELVGAYTNVGEDVPVIDESLSLNVSWEHKGKNVNVIYPDGNIRNINEDYAAYIQVVDDYGNPIQNEPVVYSITGVNATNGNVEGKKTDSDGLVKVDLPKPGPSAANKSSTITVTVDGVSYNGSPLQYKETNDTYFGLMSAKLDTTNADSPEIRLTFSATVNQALLKKGMFNVESTMEGVNNYAIDTVSIGNSNNVVILKLKPESKNIVNDTGKVTVKVIDCVENGITYKLADRNGRNLCNATYMEASFTPKTQYTMEAKVSDTNRTITVTVKDSNGRVVTNLNNETVGTPISGYSSAIGVIPNNTTGLVLLSDTTRELVVEPIESNTTVYFYYCGASCSVTVNKKTGV